MAIVNSENIFQPTKFSNSYSGLPESYRTSILDSVVPKLTSSINNYESNIDNTTKAASELYGSMGKKSMRTDLQGILDNLASRGVLKGSVASDTISKGMGDIVNNTAQKGYEAAALASSAKTDLPKILASLANLGSYSKNENPLQPYELMTDFFKATM